MKLLHQVKVLQTLHPLVKISFAQQILFVRMTQTPLRYLIYAKF